MRRKTIVLVGILLSASAQAQTVPLPPQPVVTGSSLGGAPQGSGITITLDGPVPIVDPAIGGINNGVQTLDSTIAMLAKLIDIAAMIPVFGPYAQTLKPILNTYIDLRTTAQPLLDTMNRARAYAQQYLDAGKDVQKLFSGGSLNSAADDLQGLLNQVSNLPGLPASMRVVKASDARASTAQMAESVNQMIKGVRQEQGKAKATGDLARYRQMIARERELMKIRNRIQATGERIAEQHDQQVLTGKMTQSAVQSAKRGEQFANEMNMVQSDVGSLKILGRIGVETINAQNQGFNTLSQQLALISKQQTVSNEQSDQLLQHFQDQERRRTTAIKAALDAETDRQAQEYKQMVSKADQLADSIGQTLKPDTKRLTDARTLLVKP
ncbi:hypothetical protein DVJ83_16035 (plasmid) [Deinococcus wulumuqiensis]|uniref:Phage tail tape measure protein n=1 Tax=Deinococcus wulumuqiensis TaxID=980427 RepID=A0A345ILU1_9DEIO|nr:hypothetical protein [Deinococcus wulumuqiensis]AXH00664.1 hypothetical protein DVJ83_16035 [Deinococcus wulumuqiensis]